MPHENAILRAAHAAVAADVACGGGGNGGGGCDLAAAIWLEG